MKYLFESCGEIGWSSGHVLLGKRDRPVSGRSMGPMGQHELGCKDRKLWCSVRAAGLLRFKVLCT